MILGHTNEPEYKQLQNNEFMEALRDRTVKIDVPYITTLADEIKIYEKDFNARARSAASTSPRTRSRWRRCGRCSRGSRSRRSASLTLLQKLKLYNGKTLPGFTEDNIKELREEADARGHGRHLAALRAGQDLQRPGRATRGEGASTRSWC